MVAIYTVGGNIACRVGVSELQAVNMTAMATILCTLVALSTQGRNYSGGANETDLQAPLGSPRTLVLQFIADNYPAAFAEDLFNPAVMS